MSSRINACLLLIEVLLQSKMTCANMNHIAAILKNIVYTISVTLCILKQVT